MSVDNFSYLVTILIFAGTSILIELLFVFRRVKSYIRLLTTISIIGIFYAWVAELAAIKIGIWNYSNLMNLGMYILGVPLETLVYTIFVVTAIALPTLTWSDYEDRNKPIIKTTVKKLKIKLKHYFI